MDIKQNNYQATAPPKDREILARFKPSYWPHLVKWNGEAWQLVGRDIVKSNDALIDWSEKND